MLKFTKIFSEKKNKKETNLVKPDFHTHRKDPLESLKAKSLAQEAIKDTDELINKLGPRITGSSSTISCAEAINTKFEKFCDFSSVQNFNHKGKAYDFWLQLVPYIYIASLVLLFFGFTILPLLLNASFLYYVYREFVIYKPLFEKHVKNTKGVNVHGVIEPKEEVKQTLIFSAHHDSSRLLNYNRGDRGSFLNVELPFVLFGFSIIVLLVQLLVDLFTNKLFKLGLPSITSVIFIALLLLCSPIIFKLKNYFSKEGSPGAGDNLISSNILIQLARYFDWRKYNNKSLKNTRLIFVSFDAEEVGIRGSRVWFEKHEALLKNPMQLNFDCIYNSKDLVFVNSDINGLKPLSKELAQKCVKLANDMGFEAKNHPLPLFSGATDAASGYQANVEACTMMAIDFSNGIKRSYFHTKEDTVDKIEVKAVENAISIAIKLANNVDDNNDDQEIESVDEENDDELNLEDMLQFKKISRR